MVAPHTTPSDHDLELLSAYLDGELAHRERISLEQRLDRETELRAALDDLRETVMIVRDLPPLKAPRNFTLDPVLYRRPIPWWQQLFTLGNVLQFSGAVGTMAALLLIVSAFMLGSNSANDGTSAPEAAFEQVAEPGEIAMFASPTRAFEATATLYAMNQATAIANSNTDAAAFDATLETQSEIYATKEISGTMTAESLLFAVTATPWPTQTMPPRLTATMLSTEVMPMGAVESQADTVGGQAFEESTSEGAVSFAAGEDTADDAALPTPQPLIVMPSPMPESPTMLQAQPSASDTEDDDTGEQWVGTPEAALDMADSDVAAGDENATAMREAQSTPSPALKEATASQTPTAMPVASGIGDETNSVGAAPPADMTDGQQDAEAPTPIEPMMAVRNANKDDSRDYTVLAFIGVMLLAVSLVAFMVGRRRSRRA
ncbi:MAG: hypothetical protein JXA10_14790 [Anaerolineae bacterium]|nr:hypothetical protein [Anaerolineae bacterium]